MRATNININDFIHILTRLRDDGSNMVNPDMIPDENEPAMNKLIIHPVKIRREGEPDMPPMHDPVKHAQKERNKKISIRNPNINRENNDIFGAFEEYL